MGPVYSIGVGPFYVVKAISGRTIKYNPCMALEKPQLSRAWEWLGHYGTLQTLAGIFAASGITFWRSSMIPDGWNAPQMWAWALMWFSGIFFMTVGTAKGLRWICQKMRTESSRFGDLKEGLEKALHTVASYQDGHETLGSVRETVRPMRVRLQQFSVPCPEVDEVDRRLLIKLWSSFLADVVPLVEQHHLKAAKGLFKITPLDQLKASAYLQVRDVFRPETLNPAAPGNPHFIKELAKNTVNNLRSKLVAQGLQTPSPINVENRESLLEWHEYLSSNAVSI